MGILVFSLCWLAACKPAPTAIFSSPSPDLLTVSPASFAKPAIQIATLTVTPLPEPTDSPAPSPTDTPAFTPSPTNGTSSYRLRPWTEQDSQAWAEKAEFDPDLVFQMEHLLRYPTSEIWQTKAWEVVRKDPRNDHLPGIPPGQTAFAWLLEDLLNQQNIAIEEIKSVLANYYIWTDDPLTVKNLFGDGLDTVVFNVEAEWHGRYCATFALRQMSGFYQVETISDWNTCSFIGVGFYPSLEPPVDTNGNGLPEIINIIREERSFSHYSGEGLEWSEWDRSAKGFTSKYIGIFQQICEEFGDGPCIGKHTFQNKTLTTSEFWYTQNGCPDLEVQRIYRWNGEEYAFLREQLVPAPAEPSACRLAWADQVIRWQGSKDQGPGWKNDQAVELVADVLENWSADIQDWGPAGKDYFQLRLGIWRDLRGESAAALELLQSMAAQPTNPKYDLPSRLAAIYLENRLPHNVFKACLAVENAWNNAILSDLPETYYFSDLKNRWGFVNYRWNQLEGLGVVVESLCSFDDGLTAGAWDLQISSALDLQRWLEDAGVQTLGIEAGDINQDGRSDYLAVARLTDRRSIIHKILSFVQTSQGFVVSKITNLYDEKGEEQPKIPLDLMKFQSKDTPYPVFILYINSDFVAFRIDPDGKAEMLIDHPRVNSYAQVPNGVSVVWTDWDENTRVSTYTWDSVSEQFIEQYAGYDFAGAAHAVEQLLFVEQNFRKAIVQINTFLIEAPPEPRQGKYCDESSCTYDPDWYHPYLRYCLGIAYEMAGMPEFAVDIYYHLWQDYPDHIFGQAAADKLILKQP